MFCSVILFFSVKNSADSSTTMNNSNDYFWSARFVRGIFLGLLGKCGDFNERNASRASRHGRKKSESEFVGTLGHYGTLEKMRNSQQRVDSSDGEEICKLHT